VAQRDRTAYLLLSAMALCFGGTWVAGKVAVDEIPPATIAAARFLLAALALYVWGRARHAPLRRLERADIPLALGLGLTAVAGYNLLFLYGVELAPASDGAIIVPGLAPILTAVLAWLILGERIGPRAVAGFALALGGLVLVVDPAGGVDADRLAGAGLFFAGAACWGVYSILGKAALTRFDPVAATLYGTVAGALMLLPFSFTGNGWSRLAEASLEAWASVLYLAIVGTVLAFVLFYEGVQRIGPSRAAAFALLVPIVGVLSSVLLLDEDLAALTVAGGVLVLAGLWLVQSRRTSVVAAAAGPARVAGAARARTSA
jgi:drug/metabolite transporter (DMT)-like permease